MTPWQRSSSLDQLPREELLVHRMLVHALHQLLVEHVDEHVAGDVGRVHGAGRAGGAERPLREPAVLVAREDRPPVLELVDVARRLAREDLDRVLVAEVVRALDRVIGVDLGIVLRRVAERRVDAAFGRAGVAARRVELGDDADVRAGIVSRDRRAHSCAARAHDQDVVLRRPRAKDAIDHDARRKRQALPLAGPADAARRPVRSGRPAGPARRTARSSRRTCVRARRPCGRTPRGRATSSAGRAASRPHPAPPAAPRSRRPGRCGSRPRRAPRSAPP